MNKLILSSLFVLFAFGIKANSEISIQQFLYELGNQSKQWLEGFQQNVGGNEFSYHSFRNDVTQSLITRCTDGKMPIVWETAVVPSDWNQPMTGFLWIAALDLTSDKFVFDVYVNGTKRFELPSSNQKQWKITSEDGGTLSYLTVETDQNDDALGYMWMEVPESWLVKGKAQQIKIVGRAESSNTWVIVYQATDALSYLQNSLKYNVRLEMDLQPTGNQLKAKLNAPFFFAGQQLNCQADGKKYKLIFTGEGDHSSSSLTLPISCLKKEFRLADEKGNLLSVEHLGDDINTTRLLSCSVLINQSVAENGKVKLVAQRNYQPKTVSSLQALSQSKLGNGQIFIMNSSHQDIAWMDAPEKCVIERDTMLLSPMLEKAKADPAFRFDVEDALMLKEYIERHPDKKELVKEMLAEGRISCGSAFTQPYEEMYSGESLARQFYFGAKWLKDEFDYKATVYWNEDVPGRTPQMMQLMSKAGTKDMMISRVEQGLYRWYSPDGSSVVVYTPGHYSSAFGPLQRDFYDAAQFLASVSLDWEHYYSGKNLVPIIPILSDTDMSPAKSHQALIRSWDDIHQLQNDQGEEIPVLLPEIKEVLAPEFFTALENANPDIPVIKGERPDVWLYIHGPSHQKALKASREADILLTMAEKFATVNALVDGNFNNYPVQQLKAAWEAKIYPDHGWGGKMGNITDNYFLQKYLFARSEAENILDENLAELAAKVKTQPEKGRPLVVFNSLNWSRTDLVSQDLNFGRGEAFSVTITDENGKEQPVQLGEMTRYPDGSIRSALLLFIAKEVPSVGYKTYYMHPHSSSVTETEKQFTGEAENQFYHIKFANGGLSSIYDKELGKELVNADKFVAGEVFTMHSEGNGAGEFADIQHPDMQGFDKTGNYKTEWKIVDDGPVCTVYQYRQPIANAVIEQTIRLFHQEKRIDFEPALLNWEGVLYREFRMALPLNMTDGKVTYEVPYSTVTVGTDELEGAAGERYTTPCKEMHPRGIENWISASNNEFGLTMSSSVAVADWIDPTDNPLPNTILQSVLLASRKSCHWEGNEFLQTGNHYFYFSITSHRPGWTNGADFGRQANEKLQAVWADHPFKNASLPERMSFFKTDQPQVWISCIKKAEDSDEVVVRLVETEGKDKLVHLESFKKMKQAKRTNLIEEELNALKVNNQSLQIEMGHHSIETIKLK